jgi:hypothetical protein
MMICGTWVLISGALVLIPKTTDDAMRSLLVFTFLGTIATWFMKWDITPHSILLATKLAALYVFPD